MITLAAGFETKDWVSNSIAGLALIATISLGVWTNLRSRAGQARQDAMAQAQHDTNSRLAEIMERLADRAAPGDGQIDEVEWTVEHSSKRRWLLRNLGPATATGVSVDLESLGGARVDLAPDPPADLGPGDSLSITAIETWGAPLADEVKVRWDGDKRATLALPRWH